MSPRSAAARFPWRLFSRIVLVQAVLLLLALGLSALTARYFFKRVFISQVESQLAVTLKSITRDLPGAIPPTWCQTHGDSQALRLTLITREGKVVCDSHHDAATMDDHANRPEIVEAQRAGLGHAVRYSHTLGQSMLYGALALSERGLIARGAIPLERLVKGLGVFDTSLAVFLAFLATLLAFFAAWSARALVQPIGDLLAKAQGVLHANAPTHDDDFSRNGFGELSELEDSLDDIRRDLEAKAERLNLEREEHATLMGAISDAILAVDLDGAPLFYNSRFAVLLGQSELRTRQTRLWEMFRDPEILDAFRAAFRDGRLMTVNAFPIDQNHTRKFFSIAVSPLRRRNGDIYGAVGVFHDVTGLKRAEQIRIDFVANVSHELRTPLTAITGYSDTLRQDIEAGRPAEKQFVDVIGRNATRLMSLINDLLDLSSLESNVDELHKSALNTEEITSKVLAQLQGNFASKRQSVALEARATTVVADPRRIEQVLVNLIDNAGKYTPAGGKITVSWNTDEKGDTILSVKDSGPGIPPEHHTRLFERFYRVDKARSRELGGTGLGLAIVKHIMQRHDGNVWVESELGHGATFFCRFPA